MTDDEKGKVSGHTLEGYQLAGGHQEDRGTNRGQDSKTSSGRARVAHGKKSSRSRLSKVLSKEDTGEAGTASETVAPPKAKRGRPKGSGTKIKRTYAQGAPQPEKTAKTKYVFKSNSNCRKDKSLTTLTARFLGHFELQEKKDVWIDQASADLSSWAPFSIVDRKHLSAMLFLVLNILLKGVSAFVLECLSFCVCSASPFRLCSGREASNVRCCQCLERHRSCYKGGKEPLCLCGSGESGGHDGETSSCVSAFAYCLCMGALVNPHCKHLWSCRMKLPDSQKEN